MGTLVRGGLNSEAAFRNLKRLSFFRIVKDTHQANNRLVTNMWFPKVSVFPFVPGQSYIFWENN